MLEELYQEIILDHYRRPHNKGKASPADFQAHDNNPLCGDEIEITVRVADGKFTAVISTANATRVLRCFKQVAV